MDLDDMNEINPVVNGGADTITVGDLSATGVDEVNVNLEPNLGTPGGDGLPDRVIAAGTDGDDAVTVAAAPTARSRSRAWPRASASPTPKPSTAWPSTPSPATTRSTPPAWPPDTIQLITD